MILKLLLLVKCNENQESGPDVRMLKLSLHLGR